jgi:uncharacterized protein (DUF2336 family)
MHAFDPSEQEASNVRHFLRWARSASEQQRAEAALTLAWAFRYIVEPHGLHVDLEFCIASLLDDPSPLVRRALAEAIADVPDAPRYVVIALADDRPDIASVVLSRSRVFTEAELAQYAAAGEECVQLAIARRADLPAAVAACLSEKAGAEVVAALVRNTLVRLPAIILRQVSGRFGADREICDAMLERSDLPPFLRCDLTETAVAARVARFSNSEVRSGRIERVTRMVMDRCVVRAASTSSPEEIGELVRHLRAKGALTTTLILRALASGESAFFEAVVAELSSLDLQRVAALARHPMSAGFAALLRRAGFAPYCLAPLRFALLILKGARRANRGRVLRPVASRLIDYCAARPEPEIGAIVARLRGLEKEAALDDARAFAKAFEAQRLETIDATNELERLETPLGMALLEKLDLLEMSATPFAMAC